MAEMISFSMIGLRELEKTIKELGVEGRKQVLLENRRTLRGIHNDYRSKLLQHKDTNALYNGAVFDSKDNWVSGEVGNTEPHSKYLESGTQAHRITAKVKKWLVFFWDKVGDTVFAKQVQHPGTPARPYLMESAIKWIAGHAGRVKQRLDKIK